MKTNTPRNTATKRLTNAAKAVQLLQTKGRNVTDKTLKSVARDQGYRYSRLKENYDNAVKLTKILEG